MESLGAKIQAFLAVGSGDGCGYGSGYGSGSGSGSGYGDGYGDGDISSFCGKAVYMIDKIPTILDLIRGTIAKGWILQDDLTLTPTYVAEQGNVFAHGETIHEAVQSLQEKLFEDMPLDERIDEFRKHFQEGCEYPAREFYEWHGRLTGSCEAGRKAFAKDRGIDLEHDMFTIEEFVNLAKDAYGGGIVRRLLKGNGDEIHA